MKLSADTSVDLKDGGMTVLRESLLSPPGSQQIQTQRPGSLEQGRADGWSQVTPSLPNRHPTQTYEHQTPKRPTVVA